MSLTEIERGRIAHVTSRVTRDQQAVAELGVTRYSAGVREILVIAFLLTIVAVPLFETVSDIKTNLATRRQMLARGADVGTLPGRRPRSLDILNMLPSWQAVVSARGLGERIDLLPRPGPIRAYEDSLVLNSAAGKLIRPWFQWVLTRWLGTGSEKVIIGRDGSLFYADGVRYVTGPGFLAAEQLARRSSRDGVPDPRLAIRQFSDELKRMGAVLVILPVPDEAMIRPTAFSPLAQSASAGTQNPSWEAFSADLRQHQIPLLDITQEMYDQEKGGTPQFLLSDSHWSPAGVDVAARALADFLTNRVGLPHAARVPFVRRRVDFVRPGDLAALLNLPRWSQEAAPSPRDHLVLSQVTTPSGARWQPDPASDILLIGDSFLEMYSIQENGTAPAAGLAEQLSYHLQRSTDRIASHRWGEYGARSALGDSLDAVRAGARGRKVVIWEFAIRALAVDTWKLMR